jgi:hypothetical protein
MKDRPLPVEDWIDLHTFRPGDVPDVVESYLEAAWEAGFREVRLVHGRGMGVQRDRVRGVLARHPRVLSYGDAEPRRGGWGATVAVLGEGGPPPAQVEVSADPAREEGGPSLIPWVVLGAAFLAAAAFLIVVLLKALL